MVAHKALLFLLGYGGIGCAIFAAVRERNFICGGSFFFTANLAERRLGLVVDDIVSAKDDGFCCRSTHPTVLVLTGEHCCSAPRCM